MPVRDDPEAWQQLRALVDRIALLDPVARDAVIRGACGDDEEVEEELRNLLSAYDELSTHAPDAVDSIFEPIDPDAAPAIVPRTSRTHVGEFRLADVLGNGPRGTVYRADRLAGDGPAEVALKLLHRMPHDDSLVRGFDVERERLARLRHPQVAPLCASGRTRDGVMWQATEVLEGTPITEWCARRSLSLDQRLDLFMAACDAVRAAHAQLIAHRNLKPSNVIVLDDGTVRVLDFDLGLPLPKIDALLPDGQPAWPAHAAPEQLRGEAAGIPCDVHQFGALLYELASGHNVLRDADIDASEVEATILNRVPARPSEVAAAAKDDAASRFGFPTAKAWAKALKGDLDAVVLRALRKEPEQRYASVSHLVEDLQRYRNGERTAARGDASGGWREWFKRR